MDEGECGNCRAGWRADREDLSGRTDRDGLRRLFLPFTVGLMLQGLFIDTAGATQPVPPAITFTAHSWDNYCGDTGITGHPDFGSAFGAVLGYTASCSCGGSLAVDTCSGIDPDRLQGSGACNYFYHKAQGAPCGGTGYGGWVYWDTSGCPADAQVDPESGLCVSDAPKNLGANCQGAMTGHPIHIGTGNTYLAAIDYAGAGPGGLSFGRHYNAHADSAGSLGSRWRHTFEARLFEIDRFLKLIADDGRETAFEDPGDGHRADADVNERIEAPTAQRPTWRVVRENGRIDEFDGSFRLISSTSRGGLTITLVYSDGSGGPDGGHVLDQNGNPTSLALPAQRLIRVQDAVGRVLAFGYDINSRLIRLAAPDGSLYRYGYDAPGNLVSVTYPDGSTRTYHYNEPAHTGGTDLPHALTGITDENGIRFATYQYDASGRAISESLAGGADTYQLTFGDNQTTIADPLGSIRNYTFQNILGVLKQTGQSQPGGSGCGPAAQTLTYDANGNLATRIDFNGHRTNTTYDLTRNLEISRTEGLTAEGVITPATRTLDTAWHPTWRLPRRITERDSNRKALRSTEIVYDDHGNRISESVRSVSAGTIRTTTWTYTYNPAVPGHVDRLVIDGPRTDLADITTLDYWPADAVCPGTGVGYDKGCRGQIRQITDATGAITRFDRYNPHGQVELIRAPNGLQTDLVYDLRQRLTRVTRSNDSVVETTEYHYDPAGQLIQVVSPDGSTVNYSYDPAHRLIRIADALGNKIDYTLDPLGNRIGETATDPSGILNRSLARNIDALSRVQSLTGLQ